MSIIKLYTLYTDSWKKIPIVYIHTGLSHFSIPKLFFVVVVVVVVVFL